MKLISEIWCLLKITRIDQHARAHLSATRERDSRRCGFDDMVARSDLALRVQHD